MVLLSAPATCADEGEKDDQKRIEALQSATKLAGLVMEYIRFTGQRPSPDQGGLDLLVNRPKEAPIPRRWKQLVDSIPKDPWGNDFMLLEAPDKDQGRVRLLVYSYGPDGKLGNDDVWVNWVTKE